MEIREMRRILCFAHRGASGHEPENTLLAVEKAIVLGADWVEVDVYAVDGELIIIHDDRLERTTNGSGYVMEKTLEHLRSLDAGKGQRIPTLRELFDLVNRRIGVNVELKGPDTAGLTVSLIDQYVKERGWDNDQFIVSSFNQRELGKAHRLKPQIRVGVVIGGMHRRYAPFARRHDVFSVHPRMDLVTAGFVERAHRRGLKVFVYTVNDPKDMVRLKTMGADGIFTDFPERIPRTLSSQT
jgi:glycerophosphoryl diester phosphodiesterase